MTPLRILAGSRTSPDDDRSQYPSVGFAGVEQDPDPVVLEVAEPEADPVDALDQVVERLGGAVGDPGQVEVGDPVEPGPDGASELLDFGRRHGLSQAVALELFEYLVGLVGILRPIEVTETLLGLALLKEALVGLESIAQLESRRRDVELTNHRIVGTSASLEHGNGALHFRLSAKELE
jgi:hypothetical protein